MAQVPGSGTAATVPKLSTSSELPFDVNVRPVIEGPAPAKNVSRPLVRGAVWSPSAEPESMMFWPDRIWLVPFEKNN